MEPRQAPSLVAAQMAVMALACLLVFAGIAASCDSDGEDAQPTTVTAGDSDAIPTETPASTAASTPDGTAAAPDGSQPAQEPGATGARGPPVSGELRVTFLDVGQGDATLLQAPDATILIDTGRHDRSDVVPALRALGVDAIDVVAITHGHADHIGQLDRVLAAFPVAEVWMSGTPHTTRTFERALAAIEASNASYEEPRAGQTTTVGSLLVEVLNPARLTFDLHQDSLSMRITYGSVSFLFTGDAEARTEAEIVARHPGQLAAHIYQAGHHGSRTSTTPAFLAAVSPAVAVYSAGAGNQYGHPHPEVVQRLTAAGVEVYGTDAHGSVTVTTDGTTWRVETARAGAPSTAPDPPPPPPPAPSTGGCAPGQVDINTASPSELERIIHIGPARAADIVRLRPFHSVDDLVRVSGIAAVRLQDIKNQGIACVG
jgi:competence protein ComEC